jgi:hypothetical protein
MAEAMRHLSRVALWAHDLDERHLKAFRTATKHAAAYDIPQSAFNRLGEEARGGPLTPYPALADRTITTARDPQTALERGRTAITANPLQKLHSKREEVRGIGLNPDDVKFDQYRYWLNDFWLQKITNTLHDKWCVEGLVVGSPVKPNLFRIYGDSHMLGAQSGTHETAMASRMSHHAINAEAGNKRQQLLREAGARDVGQPERVVTEAHIMSHFPNQVRVAGETVSLKDWATGAHMKRVIKDLVDLSMSSVQEGKLTGVVRGASALKEVSAGLGPENVPSAHDPF